MHADIGIRVKRLVKHIPMKTQSVVIFLLPTILLLGMSVSHLVAFSNPGTVSSGGVHFDHIVIIAMENQRYTDVLGNGTTAGCTSLNSAPYLCTLLNGGSSIIKYYSYCNTHYDSNQAYDGTDPACLVSHFTGSGCSSACYTVLTSGNNYTLNGVGSINKPNLFDIVPSWKAFCEDNCPQGADHFPPRQYADTYQDSCTTPTSENCYAYTCTTCKDPDVINYTALINEANSPNPASFIWFTPTNCHNMHGDSPSTYCDPNNPDSCHGTGTTCIPSGDRYLDRMLTSLLSTSLFTSAYRTLLWLWWDENTFPPNIELGANVVRTQYISKGTSWDEFSTLRLIEDNWNLTTLAYSANAPSLTDLYVPPHDTTMSVQCSPSPVTIGTAATCTATVADKSSSPNPPTGSIGFTSNGTGTFGPSTGCTLTTATANASSCSVSYTPTSLGSQLISGSYGGDSGHLSTSGGTTLTVSPRQTSTSIACNPSSVAVNQPTSCTVTVLDASAGTPSTPTGSVAITPGGNCILQAGSCSVTVTPTVVGSLIVSGLYNGDSEHSASSGNVTVIVALRTTKTTIGCPGTARPGDTVTCAVTVTDTSPGSVIVPTGTVAWNSTNTGLFLNMTCTLTSGSCSVSYEPLGTGFHTIGGSYSGDQTHSLSSGSGTIAVAIDSTATYAYCSPSSVVINQATSCTATVNDTSTIPTSPTGKVNFATSGGGSLTPSSCTLTAVTGSTRLSSCSVTFTGYTNGTSTVAANYSGDLNHGASSSSSNAVTVNRRAVSISLACTPSSTVVNNATSCTGIVTDTDVGSPITPSGTVSFTSNSTGTFNGVCTLAGPSNSATCTITYAPGLGAASLPRADTIMASYPGDANHTATSPGAIASITINSRATAVAVSCTPNIISESQSTTCNFTVTDTSPGTPITPTGTVTFTSVPSTLLPSQVTCDLSNSSSCSVNITAPAGSANTYTLTASYGGDESHSQASGTFGLTVTSQSVGGALVPLNELAILAPFLVFASLTLSAVAAPILIYRRRIARAAS